MPKLAKTIIKWIGIAALSLIALFVAIAIGVQIGVIKVPTSSSKANVRPAASPELGPLPAPAKQQEAFSPPPKATAAQNANTKVAAVEARKPDLDPWPFTSSSAVLRCRRPDGKLELLTARIGNTEYALNGLAQARDYPAIDPVWLQSSDVPGGRVPIDPAIEAASRLCATGEWTREVQK